MSLVEFKSWWGDWSGSDKLPENTDIIYAFEAGQQSQQGEVDKLQTEIDEITKQRDSFIKAHHISMNDVCEHKDKIDEVNEKHSEEKRILHNVIEMNQAKIDELQARVGSLININESLVAYKNQLLDDIEEKGNKDEN